MQAVVLAAGEGTRLRPLTEDKPKGMVEVADKPILTHCFEQLVELGADELYAVVGYKKEAIIEYYGDEFEGIPITYAHQRERPRARLADRRRAHRRRLHADAGR
jgi:glucose-1-phosphate thymidylyltransferase